MPPSFLRKQPLEPNVYYYGGQAIGSFAGSTNEFVAFSQPKYWKPIIQAVVTGGHTYLRITDWESVGFSTEKPPTGYLSTLGVIIPGLPDTPPAGSAIFEPPVDGGSFGSEGGSGGDGGGEGGGGT